MYNNYGEYYQHFAPQEYAKFQEQMYQHNIQNQQNIQNLQGIDPRLANLLEQERKFFIQKLNEKEAEIDFRLSVQVQTRVECEVAYLEQKLRAEYEQKIKQLTESYEKKLCDQRQSLIEMMDELKQITRDEIKNRTENTFNDVRAYIDNLFFSQNQLMENQPDPNQLNAYAHQYFNQIQYVQQLQQIQHLQQIQLQNQLQSQVPNQVQNQSHSHNLNQTQKTESVQNFKKPYQIKQKPKFNIVDNEPTKPMYTKILTRKDVVDENKTTPNSGTTM